MKRTDKLTNLIAIVLFLAFLAYAGIYTYRALTDQTVTAEATLTTVSVGGTASGIVIRSETVLESDEPYLDISAADGTKVGRGSMIAMAMRSDTGLERANRIRALELEISKVSAALGGISSAGDLTARNDKLRAAVLSLTGAVARGETELLDSAALNLSYLVFDDAGASATEQDLHALQSELDSLRNSSSTDTIQLCSDVSGIFSSLVDGYEHLTPDDLTDLSPAKLRNLIDSQQSASAAAYGKLVTEFNWYFAAVMSTVDSENLAVGKSAALDFGKYYGSTVSARVVSLSAPEDGSVAVVFRCGTALADTLAMRQATASVVFEEYSGIRVPAQAIRTDETREQTYVWVITAMQLERKDVDIIYAGDGFCIVRRGSADDALREGNTLVVSGKDLYEGKLME